MTASQQHARETLETGVSATAQSLLVTATQHTVPCAHSPCITAAVLCASAVCVFSRHDLKSKACMTDYATVLGIMLGEKTRVPRNTHTLSY